MEHFCDDFLVCKNSRFRSSLKNKGALKSMYFFLRSKGGEEMELLQPFSNIFPLSGFAWYIKLNGIDLMFSLDL